jgi:hypothetical protein
VACAKQIFDQITQEHFVAIIQKAAEAGLPLAGNAGKASNSGFTLTWQYDSVGQLLEIQCLDAPFLVPCSVINGKIHDLVESCAPGPNGPK